MEKNSILSASAVPCLGTVRAVQTTLMALCGLSPMLTNASQACVRNHRGAPAVFVDGQPSPPMSMLVMEDWNPKKDSEQFAYYRKLGAAGFRVFYVPCATIWRCPATAANGGVDGAHAAIGKIQRLLAAVPDARIMLRLNVSPPKEWVEAHPEEMVTYDDGSHRRVICNTISDKPLSGMLSLCSGKWRERGAEALEEFFGVLDRSPVKDRVIGTFLCAGGTSEWYYPIGLVTPEGRYGDFSTPFRREYERSLRSKYGSEDALRRAWGRPDATFAHPPVPTPDEQDFVFGSDSRIRNGLHNWECEDRQIGKTKDTGASANASFGVFLNLDGYAHVKDFYDAWHEGTAETIIHFARRLKDLSPHRLVGAFYGSCGCTGYYAMGTATGTRRILDSGSVDFLAAPGVYNNREPGGVVAQREMQDSFRIRNRIFVCEDDSRTHLCRPWMQRDAMGLYDVEASLQTLKRDFCRNLCEGLNGWWFDMGNGWYDDPDILALLRRQQEIAAESYESDRTKRNEIALVYDTDSMHLVSDDMVKLAVDYYRTSDLNRIGAPVDYYFHEDLASEAMPDYKLYVMINQYALTDAEREAVYAKARRNAATVLWLYAPGFADLSAERKLSDEHVSKTVGMTVRCVARTAFPHFRVDPSAHPALADVSPSRRFGVIDADLHSNIWLDRSLVQPAYVNPYFFIDDPCARVLGRFCSDGKAALAFVERDGVKSVYAATPVVQAELLRAVARLAGCHVYADGDDVLYANEHFVAIHAARDGVRRIRFARKCSPYEMYERRSYGNNVEAIDVKLRLGETRLWRID